MKRWELADGLHNSGANCAQAVACAFCDVTGLPQETVMDVCGGFGGGFRTGEICGAVSGAVVVLGVLYPHREPGDLVAKEFLAEKTRDFQRRFLEKFPGICCRDLKELPGRPEVSTAACQLGLTKSCAVYIVTAVEILEEMLAEDGKI